MGFIVKQNGEIKDLEASLEELGAPEEKIKKLLEALEQGRISISNLCESCAVACFRNINNAAIISAIESRAEDAEEYDWLFVKKCTNYKKASKKPEVTAEDRYSCGRTYGIVHRILDPNVRENFIRRA